MKTKNSTIKIMSMLVVMALIFCQYNVFAAASVTASVGNEKIAIGETTSLSIRANGCAGLFSVKSSDSSKVSVSSSSTFVEGSSMETAITLTAKAPGTVTITISALDVTESELDANGQPVAFNGSTSVTIIVPDAPDPEPGSTPDTDPTPTPDPEPEKPQEPNFTNTNKTMYANGDINLRDSWTTSSNATRIEKGTEVTVIATSTNTVNGYVWYKVSYNGQTKYVAGYLLTDKEPEEEKSDNANLKSLTVEGQELLPEFSSDVTSYSINVKTEVEELKIKAVAEDEKATVDIKGNKDLKLGDNVVTISVNAEDGTIKIYEIKVTRADEIPLGLKTLKIEGTDIHKTFKADVFEYDIDIEEDLKELEIEAIANDEKATVEILGNEELQEGENLITIIVKSEDGKETVTYQITVNKILKVEEEPVVDASNNSNNTQIYIYIGIIVVAGIALIALLVYFIKNRNTQKIYYAHSDYEDEEDFEGFPEELPEKKMFEDEEEDDPNPFGRRGKHF